VVIKEFERGKKRSTRRRWCVAVVSTKLPYLTHLIYYYIRPSTKQGGFAICKRESKAGGDNSRRVIELNQNGAQAPPYFISETRCLYMTQRNERPSKNHSSWSFGRLVAPSHVEWDIY